MTRDWISELPRDRLIAEFSMWSANLIRLEDDLKRIAGHADVLHIDVADGHFAPAMLFFPDLVAAMRKVTAIPVHVHLMVDDQQLVAQAQQFAEAGADLISVHGENKTADAAIDAVLSRGIAAGVVLKVDTPIDLALRFLDRIRFLTLLGTAIGVKGQGLNEHAPQRLRDAGSMIAACGANKRIVLAADGGIRDHTVPQLRVAGAETVVLGSLAFGAPSLAERMQWLKNLG
jgi:ribulose-phosphate 3-epimerase